MCGVGEWDYVREFLNMNIGNVCLPVWVINGPALGLSYILAGISLSLYNTYVCPRRFIYSYLNRRRRRRPFWSHNAPFGCARKWKNYYSFPVQRHARRRRVDDDERDNINMRRRVGVVRTGDIYSTLEYWWGHLQRIILADRMNEKGFTITGQYKWDWVLKSGNFVCPIFIDLIKVVRRFNWRDNNNVKQFENKQINYFGQAPTYFRPFISPSLFSFSRVKECNLANYSS